MSQGDHKVSGVRARYSKNGGAHKIEALLLVEAGKVYDHGNEYWVEHEMRQHAWEVYHVVYVGLDLDAAHAADVMVMRCMREGTALTE